MARVFSGIQPSGELHIGNYLGAIQNWVALQETHECVFCIVDYHAITQDYDPAQLSARTFEMAVSLLASGIDPTRSILFVQSHVPEHAELAWVFTTVTPIGELERMTQFKDKAQRQESVLAGLLNYPVLQAADVLLYRASLVPVGDSCPYCRKCPLMGQFPPTEQLVRVDAVLPGDKRYAHPRLLGFFNNSFLFLCSPTSSTLHGGNDFYRFHIPLLSETSHMPSPITTTYFQFEECPVILGATSNRSFPPERGKIESSCFPPFFAATTDSSTSKFSLCPRFCRLFIAASRHLLVGAINGFGRPGEDLFDFYLDNVIRLTAEITENFPIKK